MTLHGMVGRNPETSRLDSTLNQDQGHWRSKGKNRFSTNSVQIRRRDSKQN